MDLLEKTERITVDELNRLRSTRQPHLLIDVRTNSEYEMCHLSNSLNIHINSLDKNTGYVLEKLEELKQICDDPKSKRFEIFMQFYNKVGVLKVTAFGLII